MGNRSQLLLCIFIVLIFQALNIWPIHAEDVKQASIASAGRAEPSLESDWLSDYVAKNIPWKYNLIVNDYGDFRWKRKAGEPFITYPAIRITKYVISGIDENTANPSDLIDRALKTAYAKISRSVYKVAKSHGLRVDELNTHPLLGPDNTRNTGIIAFTGIDKKTGKSKLYSIVFQDNKIGATGLESFPSGWVTVAFGEPERLWDKLYDSLGLKADPTLSDHFSEDYVKLSNVGSYGQNGELFDLTDSRKPVMIGGYSFKNTFSYYFDGKKSTMIWDEKKNGRKPDFADLEAKVKALQKK